MRLKGEITAPPDKSISHRAVMLGAIARGVTTVENFLTGADCMATADCFHKLGIKIEIRENAAIVYGKGLRGLSAPSGVLDAKNSGTTLRLATGILAAQNFDSEATGDESIQKRPMRRVTEPLSLMGARIIGERAPLKILGSRLTGITYELKEPSAQVKSAILLASLYADSPTVIIEKIKSRNHTEIMLNAFGANITKDGDRIISRPVAELSAATIRAPGDISSAAFFIVGALICEGSELLIKDVGINPTRSGILDALCAMGADLKLLNVRRGAEPVADILVKSSQLEGIVIKGDIIPRLIDEIPILAVAAMFAKGETIIRDAAELRVKETDRISAIAEEFSKLGANIVPTPDGLIIKGVDPNPCFPETNSRGDHRIAMSLAIAGLKIPNKLINADCVNISFPGFFDGLLKIMKTDPAPGFFY
jgi:3-phosphoshikimate 1-carboxyvinyltransferase